MSVELHLLNGNGQLNQVLKRIDCAFHHGVAVISTLLDLPNVDVVIRADVSVIPETGMLGYSPSAHAVYLTMDPSNENLFKNFDTEFVATLGHELHHCKRHAGPGYGRTLGEALVTEGLACHFETELRAGAVPFYADALESVALEDMWVRAQQELMNSSYDHRSWFFGSPHKAIPRHAGYSLGFNIVTKYIQNSGTPASRLWSEPAEAFYAVA